MYYCFGITEKGRMTHNEDALLIGGKVVSEGTVSCTVSEPFVTAVSDGVSSEVSGETASRMCLEKINGINFEECSCIADEIMKIHHEIRRYSEENPEYSNMQATLCGIAVDGEKNVISFNTGDSRLYRLKNGVLEQITRDQSLVQILYEDGAITLEEKRTHVNRNLIFPVMGNVNSNPQIDEVSVESMETGEMFMLCTDGLSDYIEHSEIEKVLDGTQSPQERLEILVKKAIDGGSRDNITAILIICGE